MQDNEINQENNGVEGISGDQNLRVYEVGYLLVPTLKEEDVPMVYGNLKELISSLGGQVISDEMPVMINLAYTMTKVIQNIHNKYDTAYFGWVKFFMESDKILELKKKMNLDSNIIRFLTLKTIKENTIASKRFIQKDTLRKKPGIKKDEEGKEEVVINKEEIDKEIDAMVAN